MQTKFAVDFSKKKEIQNNYIRKSKWPTVLSLGLLAAIVVFTVTFAVYGFGMRDTFLVQDITASDYGQKNIVLVWVLLITVDVILLFLWFVQKLVVYEVFSKYIDQRVNESLTFSDDVLEYGYQNSVGASSGDRVVVRVPLKGIREIIIDQKIHRIELIGLVSSKYYKNYAQRNTKAPEDNYKEGSLVIFDYFEPGLTGFVKKIPEKRSSMRKN